MKASATEGFDFLLERFPEEILWYFRFGSLEREMSSDATVSHDTDSKAFCVGDPHLVHEHQDSIRACHLQATGRGLFLTLLHFEY